MNEDRAGQSARGWNRVSSHFDVWRQPPIMESIIARHSLSFCVPFSMANQAARLSVSRPIQPPPPKSCGPPKISLSFSLCSWSRQYEKKRLIPYRKKLLEKEDRKVRPVQVKIHPRVQECRYYIIYVNYHRRSKSIAETGSQLSSIRAYFLRSWPQA